MFCDASIRSGANRRVVGARLSAVGAISLGLLVLAGWWFDLPLLKSVIPGAVEMKANTALGLVVAGFALYLLTSTQITTATLRIAQGAALAVATLGLGTVGEYVFGWELGIDELLFRDTGNAYNPIRGRMSPFSALAFAGLGLALATQPYPSVRLITRALVGGAALIGTVSLLGYAWNAAELVTDHWLPPVAVHSALGFILLATGTLLAPAARAAEPSTPATKWSVIERKVIAGMLVAMLLLLLGGAMTYRATALVEDATRSVSHTQDLRVAISTLYDTVSDAEAAQRNYLITGQARVRSDYERLANRTNEQFLALSQLVADNPTQQQYLAQMKPLITEMLDRLTSGIQRHSRRGAASADRSGEAGGTPITLMEISGLIRRMDDHENSLLVARRGALVELRQTTLISLLITLALAAGIFMLQFSGIRREMKARREAEDARAVAEGAVRRREAELSRFKETLDQTLDCIFLFRPDTLRFTYVNRGAMVQVGYSAAELLEMTPLDLKPSGTEADFRATLEPILKNETESVITETVHRRKDGTDIPVEVHMQLVRMADGDAQFVKVVRDISIRRRAETALRNSNTRVRTILDTVADGIVTIDTHGIVRTFNPAAERIFGYSADEIVGRNINMLMPEPFHSQHDRYLSEYRATGEARIIGIERELMGLGKDGRTFPIELTVSEMKLDGERHFIGIVRDITARKLAVDQLNRFFALSLDMLCIASADGYFKRVSPAFTKTLGWSTEELLARPFLDFVHPDDYTATLHEVEKQLTAGESVLQFENRYRHKDGSWRVLSWKSAPHQDGHLFAIARDITGRKEAEQALVTARDDAVRANEAKDIFLATISHEIRTPLNGILGMLELLELSRLDAEQQELLATARDSGRGMVRIIDDVLDHAKMEAGKLKILPEPVSIPRLLQRVLNNYHAVASTKGLTLNQVDDPRIGPALLADPLRILQILGNFVSNAIKFTSSGGIEVRSEWLGREGDLDSVRLSVKDSGIGIDTAAQARLFQPFEQAAADTSRMYGGTGLGLAICRRLAEMMGGSIAVDSAPGRGTTISVTLSLPVTDVLPIDRESAAARERVSLRLPLAGDNYPQVLAVDDNPTNRALLARQLAVLGLRAQAAAGGREALALWQDGEFGIVITDCNMPDMDGYALTRAIRELETAAGRPRTVIIAWTANVLADAQERCLAAGMDEILTKPAELIQLKEVLARSLREHDDASVSASPTVPAPQPNEARPIDARVFAGVADLFDQDPALIREFLDEYRTGMAGIATTLRGAEAANDAATASAAAHILKSSARAVGALALSDLCATIEKAGMEGETGTLTLLLPRIEAEIASVETWLSGFGRTPDPHSEPQGRR